MLCFQLCVLLWLILRCCLKKKNVYVKRLLIMGKNDCSPEQLDKEYQENYEKTSLIIHFSTAIKKSLSICDYTDFYHFGCICFRTYFIIMNTSFCQCCLHTWTRTSFQKSWLYIFSKAVNYNITVYVCHKICENWFIWYFLPLSVVLGKQFGM